MSEQIQQFIDALQGKITQIAQDNMAALDQAADLCADALANQRVIHIYDTGHIISHELIVRTGGLVAFTHLSFNGILNNQNLWRKNNNANPPTDEEVLSSERALIEWVFGQKTIQEGDILIIGSVSGTGIRLVELGLQAKARGVRVIAVTGVSYSSKLESKHPSGKRLYEVAEVVLDNHADYGDAFFAIPGAERKVVPISGVSAAILMWSLTVGIVDRMVKRGLQPSIYESINKPDGPTLVQKIEAEYQQKGY